MSDKSELPSWEECRGAVTEKEGAGEPTALHRFIFAHEPTGRDPERLFREGLQAVLQEAREGAVAEYLGLAESVGKSL